MWLAGAVLSSAYSLGAGSSLYGKFEFYLPISTSLRADNGCGDSKCCTSVFPDSSRENVGGLTQGYVEY